MGVLTFGTPPFLLCTEVAKTGSILQKPSKLDYALVCTVIAADNTIV